MEGWHYDTKGIYEVKSGYRIAMQEKIIEVYSDPSKSQRWWARMWGLNIPHKVKIFIWRICNNALPSLVNMCFKKVVKVTCCPRCRQAEESAGHAIWWDDKGWVVTALSKPVPRNFSPEAGEMVALREGLLLAQKLQMKISYVELDACNKVSKISNGLADLGETEFVVDDVKALLNAAWGSKMSLYFQKWEQSGP
ncbi:hypothetical protein Dsin_024326 [Dipteronia sinensis]|uniref:Reverse transcriptase zinc-binding domain-containing protein n=1 Tax=Dipteronia sinensis TaxID=43782 RepID=A0AAD9ZTZ8_9ROSI|nr:hypothetical protein Dsin_024326 [Dipteronia sinensis]